jgi:HEAT repeat protein
MQPIVLRSAFLLVLCVPAGHSQVHIQTTAEDELVTKARSIIDAAWRSRERSDQLTAVFSLRDLRKGNATPFLAEAVRSRYPEIAAAVANVLSQSQARQLFPIIRGRLENDQRLEIRVWLIKAIAKAANEAAFEILEKSANDADRTLRGVTFDILGKMGDSAVPVLGKLLLESDEQNRETAAYVLGRIGGPRVVALLRRALNDEAAPVAEGAAFCLAQLGDGAGRERLAQMLLKPEWRVRVNGHVGLYRLGDKSQAAAVKKALLDDNPQVRDYALRMLGGRSGNGLFEAVQARLKDPVPYVRWAAADELSKSSDPRAIDVLRGLLKNGGDEDLRFKAAVRLAKTGDPLAKQTLVLGLGSGNPVLRSMAARELGELGDHRYLGALGNCLRDDHWPVRVDTLDALVKLNDISAFPAIAELLADEIQEVASKAADTMVKLDAERALPIFVKVLESKSVKTRVVAAGAILRMLRQ